MEDIQSTEVHNIIMECRHCGNKTVLKRYGRYHYRDEYEEPFLEFDTITAYEYECSLYICQTCRRPTLEEFSDTGFHVDEPIILYPIVSKAPEPSADLPEEILPIYQEAQTVLPYSPRASAALLRLAIEKLCIHFGQPGKHLQTAT